MNEIERLALQGHGAIQVDLPTEEPLKVFLAGPIKHWWSLSDDEWGTGDHKKYLDWRDAVETVCVASGFLTYSPHKAWRGAWSEGAQEVNNAAILMSDVLIDMTPKGIPAEGTLSEIKTALGSGCIVCHAPPSTTNDLEELVKILKSYYINLVSLS